MIGEPVGYGDVEISHEDAERFRRLALEGNIKVKGGVAFKLTDTETSLWMTSYASGVISDYVGDYAVRESAYYSRIRYGIDPDYWSAKLTFSKYSLQDRDTKIYSHYQVESIQGEPMLAKRNIQIIRHLAQVSFEGGALVEDIKRQYKEYEQPIFAEDIDVIADRMQRIRSREHVQKMGRDIRARRSVD